MTATQFPVHTPSAYAGIGIKPEHCVEVVDCAPKEIAWFEIHPENWFVDGGPYHRDLMRVRASYPLSFHSVGLSLGSADWRGDAHLARLAELMNRYEPFLVSDHVAWSVHNNTYYNDLFPLPYTEETCQTLCINIDRVQSVLKRQILIENPSLYIPPGQLGSDMNEAALISEVIARTGCGLLLDVNNIIVSAENCGFDAVTALSALPLDTVREIHVAGHAIEETDAGIIRIDDHGSAVSDSVWALYENAIAYTGKIHTLVEWDTDIPPLSTLCAEAEKAIRHMHTGHTRNGL